MFIRKYAANCNGVQATIRADYDANNHVDGATARVKNFKFGS